MGVDGVGDLTNPGPTGTFAGGVLGEMINAVGWQGQVEGLKQGGKRKHGKKGGETTPGGDDRSRSQSPRGGQKSKKTNQQ